MWQLAPLNLNLELNEVHIWLVDLDFNLDLVDQLNNILCEDEQIKARKFRFEYLQNRFITTRANLRIILSKYLTISPQNIVFNYGEKGKPSLVKNINPEAIEFNVSHSENLALYSFIKQKKIGIDIEKIRDNCEVENLAQRFFTNNEYQIISRLRGRKQLQAFFQAWTSKEAYLKATGEGLGGGLDKIEINLENEARKILSIKDNQHLLENWTLHKIDINQDYIATLALENFQQAITFQYFCNNYQKA